MKTTANTISRWETATYKPSISDLERLAQFFGVPITVFFPQAQPKYRANAVLSATADLDDDDLEEVMLYAQFRRTRQREEEAVGQAAVSRSSPRRATPCRMFS